MKKLDVFEISLKLVALYLLVKLIPMFEYILVSIVSAQSLSEVGFSEKTLLIGNIIPFLTIAIIGILLIKYSYPISKWLCGRNPNDQISANLSKESLQEIAFSITGLLILVMSIIPFTQAINGLSFIKTQAQTIPSHLMAEGTMEQAKIAVFGEGFKILLGLLLFCGSRFVSKLWKKVQSQQ